MKEDETRERHDKTGGVIAIDLSAVSVTVWEEAEERRETNGGQKKINEEEVKLVQISQAWAHLRESDNLIEGLCYILPAVVSSTELFSSTCGMQRVKSEYIHSQRAVTSPLCVCVCGGGRRSFGFKDERFKDSYYKVNSSSLWGCSQQRRVYLLLKR